MPLDISRKTFTPRKNFSELVSMQGRVVTDGPLNEAEKIIERRFRAETIDLIGRCGYPSILEDSFRIDIDAGNIIVGSGRYYVDGLAPENFGIGNEIFDDSLDEVRGGDWTEYLNQEYRPGFTNDTPEDGRNLFYLDVWKRPITYLEDPSLIDPAVGVDTTARMQTVWQVKRLGGLSDDITCQTPDEDIPQWLDIIAPSNARLTSRANPDSAINDPCLLPPEGGYRALDNRMYLVAIHNILDDGTLLIKWSRTNGTVATEIVSQPANNTLTVGRVAKDDFLRFNPGDWIEITDDVRVLEGLPGTMVRILSVDDASDSITLVEPLAAGTIQLDGGGPETDASIHPIIRRWDQSGIILDTDGNQIVNLDDIPADPDRFGLIPFPALGTFIALEDGVEIALDLDVPAGEMKVGDNWSFMTRSADASVEELSLAPPQATHHHYCRLALIDSLDGEYIAPIVADCRDPISDESCCTVIVSPGENIQAAINSLDPIFGGCVCLKPGIHQISEPLQILTPNITLHGESHGVTVINNGQGHVLNIGAIEQPVSGVHVTTIRFEHSSLSLDLLGSVQMRNVSESVFEDCQIISPSLTDTMSIVLADCSEVSVNDCFIYGAQIGIWADIAGDNLLFYNNRIQSDEQSGLIGIAIARVTGTSIIRQNRMDNFASGIVINADPFSESRFSNASGSIIEDNTIELVAGSNFPQVGINTACDSCVISGNRILSSTEQTGIWVTGSSVKVSENIIENLLDSESGSSLGIRVGEDVEAGSGTSFSSDVTVFNNSINRLDTGVSATDVNDLKINDNNIVGTFDLEQIGIELQGNDNSTISANRIRASGRAITSTQCRTNQIRDNQIETCFGGVFCEEDVAIDIVNNRIEDCQSSAVLCINSIARCAISGNRISNVSSEGIGIAIGGLLILGEFSVDNNEILNSGVPIDGEMNPLPVVNIAGLFVLEAQIESNLVSYSNLLENVRSIEDRALLLHGLLEMSFAFGERPLRLGYAAQISNNKFIGMGRTAMVQLLQRSINDSFHMRFERVFFNNNYCDHFGGDSGNDGNATVILNGYRVVVMGNQIKAINHGHASINFEGRRGPCMGNVTSSSIINHPDFPVPNSDFNMIA